MQARPRRPMGPHPLSEALPRQLCLLLCLPLLRAPPASRAPQPIHLPREFFQSPAAVAENSAGEASPLSVPPARLLEAIPPLVSMWLTGRRRASPLAVATGPGSELRAVWRPLARVVRKPAVDSRAARATQLPELRARAFPPALFRLTVVPGWDAAPVPSQSKSARAPKALTPGPESHAAAAVGTWRPASAAASDHWSPAACRRPAVPVVCAAVAAPLFAVHRASHHPATKASATSRALDSTSSISWEEVGCYRGSAAACGLTITVTMHGPFKYGNPKAWQPRPACWHWKKAPLRRVVFPACRRVRLPRSR